MPTRTKVIIGLIIFILLVFLALLITAQTASAPYYNQVLSLPKQVDNLIAPKPTEPADTNTTTTLIFGGDVMLSRVVGQKMVKYSDWTWPFKNISDLLASADLTIINLESPFTIGGNHLVKTGSFSFNADPQAIAGLNLAGIDLVSLANNHMLNQGQKGITDTKKILTENNIIGIGAGTDEQSAHQPAIKKINGIKFGFLSYAYPADSSVATAKAAGIADMDIEKMKIDISKLKKQADIIIVLMHAGTEYKNTPNSQQKEFAHGAIDAGTDLVVGHHPHWVETTEIYRGKPIIYSLGNLVFDQMWSKETQEGALAKVVWSNNRLNEIEIIPIQIHDYGQAKIATSTSIIADILKRMELKSGIIKL